VHLVGCTVGAITMHGPVNIKFVSAKHANDTYQYRNIKGKLYKANAAVWYNKICKHIPLLYTQFQLLMMDGNTVRNM